MSEPDLIAIHPTLDQKILNQSKQQRHIFIWCLSDCLHTWKDLGQTQIQYRHSITHQCGHCPKWEKVKEFHGGKEKVISILDHLQAEMGETDLQHNRLEEWHQQSRTGKLKPLGHRHFIILSIDPGLSLYCSLQVKFLCKVNTEHTGHWGIFYFCVCLFCLACLAAFCKSFVKLLQFLGVLSCGVSCIV